MAWHFQMSSEFGVVPTQYVPLSTDSTVCALMFAVFADQQPSANISSANI